MTGVGDASRGGGAGSRSLQRRLIHVPLTWRLPPLDQASQTNDFGEIAGAVIEHRENPTGRAASAKAERRPGAVFDDQLHLLTPFSRPRVRGTCNVQRPRRSRSGVLRRELVGPAALQRGRRSKRGPRGDVT